VQTSMVLFVVALLMAPGAMGTALYLRQDIAASTISVLRDGHENPILTQNARPDFRPYIHPIAASDGRDVLTEYGPEHHSHQTGLYWGFTRVNDRDFFQHPEGTHWCRVTAMVLKPKSSTTDLNVRWQTVYNLLDKDGSALLQETQVWTMPEQDDVYILELKWSGTASTDITIGEYDYGGMFLRLPWRDDINGQAFNSVRQANERAAAQRAVWLDVGMQVEGCEITELSMMPEELLENLSDTEVFNLIANLRSLEPVPIHDTDNR